MGAPAALDTQFAVGCKGWPFDNGKAADHPVVLQLSVSNKLLDYYGHHPIGIEHTKRKAPLMNYRKV